MEAVRETTEEKLDTVNEIVTFTNMVFDDMEAGYDTSEGAKGNCLFVTSGMHKMYGHMNNVSIAYSEHSDHVALAARTGKDYCSNHYALIIDGETVIDYTLRQFDENAAYPAILPYGEWKEVLLSKWDDEGAFHGIGNSICWECETGIDTLCDCDGHYVN